MKHAFMCLFGLLILNKFSPASPHLKKYSQIRSLIVNNQPFTILSIEDHNTIDFNGHVRADYFRTVRDLYANTISVTFRWNFFEKNKDFYDTTILRNIKRAAEKYGLKVIVLWFGSNISGHENCVPDYIREDSITYIPYTRGDYSFASKIGAGSAGRIYCYSFDDKNQNYLLLREKQALEALITWIKKNDPEETFIMLQLENELFVHPELWRPWPPPNLQPAQLLPNESKYIWNNEFIVQACSLKIEVSLKMPPNRKLVFTLVDTTDKQLWKGYIENDGEREIHIGGKFINQKCRFMVRKEDSTSDTVFIYSLKITPIAERCRCRRCEGIFSSRGFSSDQDFEQFAFIDYVKSLTSAVANVDNNFPLYLNLFVSGDARTLLGNPYCNPQSYLALIPDLDIIGPDIYLESTVSIIDSLNFSSNTVFVPETGKFKLRESQDDIAAFSLIFPILGAYQGVGVQQYDLKSSNFGLLSSEGQWEEDAYLVRNSYSAVSQLPTKLLTRTGRSYVSGFRNVTKKVIQLANKEITITPTTEPRYARGIIAEVKGNLILCGIGFEVVIKTENVDLRNLRIERGYWQTTKFTSLGKLKPDTYEIGKNIMKIRMDDDDFLSSDIFNPKEKQYCVKISAFYPLSHDE